MVAIPNEEHFPRNPRILMHKGGRICIATLAARPSQRTNTSAPICGNVVGIPSTPKKLMRPRAEKKIAGVCAGLAQQFDLDVSLVRILYFFITFATGVCPGVVTYLLAWIIV